MVYRAAELKEIVDLFFTQKYYRNLLNIGNNLKRFLIEEKISIELKESHSMVCFLRYFQSFLLLKVLWHICSSKQPFEVEKVLFPPPRLFVDVQWRCKDIK